MIKPVQGYQTEDGTFYESAALARLHDAREAVLGVIDGDGEAFLVECDENLSVIGEYISAKENAIAKQDASIPSTVSASFHYPNGFRAEEDANIQSQPIDGRGDMPDVGSGAPTEEVRDGSESDGPRSGEGYARRIRSMSIMASDESPEVK